MGLLRGATPLVELIIKKFGDDVDGATQELVRQVGYPESVARRIATGELPMDEASRQARQAAKYEDELYHGSTHDLREFDGSMTGADNDFGQGIYLTDDAYDASENYAGIGADLTNRLERHAEANWFQTDKFEGPDHVRTIGGQDFTKAQWDDLEYGQKMAYLRRDAYDEIAGETRGVMYPVTVNREGVVSSTDRISDTVEAKGVGDYMEDAAEEFLSASPDLDTDIKGLLDPDGEFYDEIYDNAADMAYNDPDNPNIIAYDIMRQYGLDEGYFGLEEIDSWQDLRDILDDKIANGWHPENDAGEYMTSGAILQEVMQAFGIKGYDDMSSASRFSGMDGGAGNHTIMFPGSENQIRSVNAAYDPQYTGSNIMGGVLAGGVGLGALGQSEESEAGMGLLSTPTKAAAATGILAAGQSDDADALILHPGLRGARDFAEHRRGDRKAPRIGRDPNGNMIPPPEMVRRIEELKLALSKTSSVGDQSRLINAFVHSGTDYSASKVDGMWPTDSWSKIAGKADGGVNGPTYITGMDILAENLVEKLGEEFTPAIEDYVRRRIGDAGKGRDASYGGEAGKLIGGKENLSGTFDPLDKAAYDASASRLPRPTVSLSVGGPSMGQDHLQATMHNREQKLNEHMQNLGLDKDSMYEYGLLAPFKQNIVTGKNSLAVPDIVRDIARGLLSLGMTPETGVYDPQSVLDVVL